MKRLEPAAVLGPGGLIARRLPGYEQRLEQVAMAEAIARSIEDGGHLMVEAGTGVGKSFAYLVPAIQAAVEQGKKVVISTHTISLQEQLLQKDIPFLRAVMPDEFSAALIKGRNNYLSLRRLQAASSRGAATLSGFEMADQLTQITEWAEQTTDGSRSDLPFRPAADVWDAVESDYGNCMGKKCRTYNSCFYYAAQRRAQTANLLIVNHALYMTHLALKALDVSVLPEHEVVIFDEAHTLPAVAGDHLGLRVSSLGVTRLLNRLHHEKTGKGLLPFHKMYDAVELVENARMVAEDFFDAVTDWRQREGPRNGRVRKPLDWPNTLGEELRRVASAIREAAADRPIEDEQAIELSAAGERCLALAQGLDSWLAHNGEGQVHWVDVEGGARRRVNLVSAPLDVAPTLEAMLYASVPTCVLTSATLGTGRKGSDDFEYVRRQIGPNNCRTLRLGSPFQFEEQAKVVLVKGLPDPSLEPDRFEDAAVRLLPHYVSRTHGKAFVLFTSFRMLERAAVHLRAWCDRQGVTLLSQADGVPRTQLIERFKADRDSVLLGVDSFWQGVDVPGDSLSNVIITRLPFSVPDEPLAEARREAVERRGGKWFQDHALPEAILKLRQGFGRLIRTRSDRGIVVILDPRVLTKAYGSRFLEALPPCPRQIDAPTASGDS